MFGGKVTIALMISGFILFATLLVLALRCILPMGYAVIVGAIWFATLLILSILESVDSGPGMG